jgi:hypothetical protein
MLMRHIMSAHANPKNLKSTQLLLELYKDVCERTGCSLDLVSHADAVDIMLSNFRSAYIAAFGADHDHLNGFFIWPAAIPKGQDIPREVCVFLGQAMGTNVGKEVKKYHSELKKRPPTN